MFVSFPRSKPQSTRTLVRKNRKRRRTRRGGIRRGNGRNRRGAQFETLESKELMAGDLNVDDIQNYDPPKIELVAGELRVIGTNHVDDILVEEFNLGDKAPKPANPSPSDRTTIFADGRDDRDNNNEARSYEGITHGVLAQVKNKFDQVVASAIYDIDAVSKIHVNSRNGNDRIENETNIPSLLESGRGINVIFGGQNNDVIFGGSDTDHLYGRGGVDDLWAGPGVDFLHGGSGGDLLEGGSSTDYMWGGSGGDTLHGGQGNDWMWGGTGGDTLDGEEGIDRIYGESGEDDLYGGEGADHLYGGDHDDKLQGNENDDHLYGGKGDDEMYGSRGVDTIHGQAGDDTIQGGLDGDFIYGGNDRDKIWGDEGHDQIWGGGGNDVIFGGAEGDKLYGDAGLDNLYGDAGADTLDGGADNDYLYGGMDGDFLTGSSGDDELRGEHGADTLDGGLGDDLLRGGDHGDSLYGGGDNDRLLGEDGDDTLNGQAGNDSLFGGLYGIDNLYGGDGADRFLDADDALKDLEDQDARLIFKNGGKVTKKLAGWPDKVTVEAGWWTNEEIETVDQALGMMHDKAGNTSLLKTHKGKEVTLYRHGEQTGGSWSVGGWNGGDEVAFTDNSFESAAKIIRVVLHEFGHFKDDENPKWDDWKDISGWNWELFQPTNDHQQWDDGDSNWWYHKNADDNFARDYSKLSPHEDFATAFAAWFMTDAGMAYPFVMGDMTEKFAFIESYVASL